MENLPFAEDINYWKTSQSSPDTWIERAIKLIKDFGGRVGMYGFGTDHHTGRHAYMLVFEINNDTFKLVWPVLSTESSKDEVAAKRQAATLLHHDIKARLLTATVLGHRTAFFNYMMLPDGRTVIETSIEELTAGIPLFVSPGIKLIE